MEIKSRLKEHDVDEYAQQETNQENVEVQLMGAKVKKSEAGKDASKPRGTNARVA